MYFVQLKAAVPGEICSTHCKPVLPMARSFLPGFGSWLSRPREINIDNFLAVEQSILVGQISLCICFFSESWQGEEAYPVRSRFVCNFLSSSVSGSNAAGAEAKYQ